MKAIDLIKLIQETCKVDDEIFISDPCKAKYRRDYNPDITITTISVDDDNGQLCDIDGERIDESRTFHIW